MRLEKNHTYLFSYLMLTQSDRIHLIIQFVVSLLAVACNAVLLWKRYMLLCLLILDR